MAPEMKGVLCRKKNSSFSSLDFIANTLLSIPFPKAGLSSSIHTRADAHPSEKRGLSSMNMFQRETLQNLLCTIFHVEEKPIMQFFKPIFDLSIKSAYQSCLRLLSDHQDAKKKKPRSRNLTSPTLIVNFTLIFI